MAGNLANNAVKLTPKQNLVLTSLLDGNTREDAAAAAGVSLRSVERWYADPQFRQVLNQAVRGAVGTASVQLVSVMETAVKTMRDFIEDENEDSAIRLRACRHVIEMGPRLVEFHDLAEQVSELQRKFESLEEMIYESHRNEAAAG